MSTVIDFSAGVPDPAAVRAAGHVGAVRYVSPGRASWMRGKPVTREQADAYRAAGLTVVSNWQYGKGLTADWRRGYAGGVDDAQAAERAHRAAGGPGTAPIYFSVDDDVTLAQWNSLAAPYLRGAASVLGQQRVGLYGHARACAWAVEDDVVGHSSTPGKRWLWQTRAWSAGVVSDHAVLYQRVIDTAATPGPTVGGVTVDVSDVLADDYGQWGAGEGAPEQENMVAYYDSDMHREFDFGGPRPTTGLIGVAIHTSEGGGLATSARALARYQLRERNGSYNVIVDRTGERLLCNTDDWIVWATGNRGNNVLVHLCFTAKASMSREQWLAEGTMLRAGATVVAHWCRKYGWPVRKSTVHSLPGVLGHADTRAWGGTDHTDPGANFPWPEFLAMVQQVLDGGAAPAPTPAPNAIDAEAAIARGWIGDRLFDGERRCADGEGRFADFEHGSIYWHPAVAGGQAVAVPAHVYQRWEIDRWEQGPLGYPVRRHTVVDGEGDVQAFQGGVIYRRYGTPGYVVHGVIGDRWFADGAEQGPLGWPISDEQPHGADAKGRIQHFERGYMVWHPSGAVEVREDDEQPKGAGDE